MKRLYFLIPLAALTLAAQPTKKPNELGLFFGNGLGLAFHTESTGSQSPLSMQGQVSTHGPNEAYRVVFDKTGRIVFAYILHSEKTAAEMKVQLRPIDQAQIRRSEWFPKTQPAGDIATVAVPRDFPALRLGDSVQVDILYHPVTGEKISDVLRVITEDPSTGNRLPVASGERFSFDRVKVVIDGKTVADRPNAWMIGQAIKIRVAGRGEYYLVLNPPQGYPFKASGWIDHNVLRFQAAGESVEITGMTNLLQKSEYGTVWIYHVPEARAAKTTDSSDFHCADSFEQLKSGGSE